MDLGHLLLLAVGTLLAIDVMVLRENLRHVQRRWERERDLVRWERRQRQDAEADVRLLWEALSDAAPERRRTVQDRLLGTDPRELEGPP